MTIPSLLPFLRSTAPLALCTLVPMLAQPAQAQPVLDIVATIGMIGDVAENIGGDCIAVQTMMGSGIDPHLYQATARDVQTLNRADLILYAGYGLEGQLADVFERYGERVPTLAVAEAAVPENELIATDDTYGVDPHLWMDAWLWSRTVPVIADRLADLAPHCADTFSENAVRYGAELDALHLWAQDTIASIPHDQRILVTAHDAFAYYGQAYGIEVAGIQGISTQGEAAIADIRETATLLAERGVPAIFVESTINPRTVEAVIAAAQQAGHDVTIGGELYSDAMGDPDTPEGTYIGMIYANTLSIAEALGGSPAPLPEALSDWAGRWSIER